MSRGRRLAIVLALAVVAAAPGARHAATPDRILVLVSLDGWRWDYIDRLGAPNLRALASRGVRAAALIPSFPVLTFPNHYTLVTGLYPEHHGIVANTMNDPAIGPRFSMSAETAKDPRWWGGEPLWVSVVRRGRRAATMFWPGTEVAIQGVRPTIWKPYVKQITTPDRVRQVLQWLALPERERPSMVNLYFDEVDTAGHDFGPDSPELAAAAAHLDDAIGQLVSGVHALGLDDRVTFVVVSDHGMAQLSPDRVVYLDDYVDPQTVDVTEWHGFLAAEPKDGDTPALYRALHGKHPALAVYMREDTPASLHYRGNPRIAPVIGLLDIGWAVTTRARLKAKKLDAAAHGFDPVNREMGALFIAAGAGVHRGRLIAPFDNVNVYGVLCEILGETPVPNDGNAAIAGQILEPASASAWLRPPR
jgi:predicted AlkP superfamily pyrophosphatase or phosphodiesterase